MDKKNKLKIAYHADEAFIESISIGNQRIENSISLLLDGQNYKDINATFEFENVIVRDIIIDEKSPEYCYCIVSISDTPQKKFCDNLDTKVVDLIKKDAHKNKYFQNKGKGPARHISKFRVDAGHYLIKLLFYLPVVRFVGVKNDQILSLKGKKIDLIMQAQSIWIDDQKNECGLIFMVHNVRYFNERVSPSYEFSKNYQSGEFDLERRIYDTTNSYDEFEPSKVSKEREKNNISGKMLSELEFRDEKSEKVGRKYKSETPSFTRNDGDNFSNFFPTSEKTDGFF